jgi:hypothetical protein
LSVGSNVGSNLYDPTKSLFREIKIVSKSICGNNGDLASFCFCLNDRMLGPLLFRFKSVELSTKKHAGPPQFVHFDKKITAAIF